MDNLIGRSIFHVTLEHKSVFLIVQTRTADVTQGRPSALWQEPPSEYGVVDNYKRCKRVNHPALDACVKVDILLPISVRRQHCPQAGIVARSRDGDKQ